MPRVRGLLAVTLLCLACASCSADSGGSAAEHPSTTATPSPSSPTPTVSPELAAYTADERAAYQAAVRAYSVFTKRNSEFLAKGQTTRLASDYYHRYSIDWVKAWANLARLANNDVT